METYTIRRDDNNTDCILQRQRKKTIKKSRKNTANCPRNIIRSRLLFFFSHPSSFMFHSHLLLRLSFHIPPPLSLFCSTSVRCFVSVACEFEGDKRCLMIVVVGGIRTAARGVTQSCVGVACSCILQASQPNHQLTLSKIIMD